MDTCLLTSLDSFPELPRLEVLELNNNSLHDIDLKILQQYPNLRRIFIRENKIGSVEALKQLSILGDLVQIELKGNPVAETPNLRDILYGSLKNVEIIDGRDRLGNEIEDISDYSEDNNSGEEEEGSSISQSQNEQDEQEVEDVARKQRKLN